PKSQRKRQKPKRKTRNQQKNHLKSEVFNLEDHFFQKLINLEVWRQRHAGILITWIKRSVASHPGMTRAFFGCGLEDSRDVENVDSNCE
ncbi:MAG: hypothetical protein NTW79_01335, partial [Candidatus Berkelbacteria bacterium]|nr:hypothetical protein [Candidatus Berkelbacteria bacterium]